MPVKFSLKFMSPICSDGMYYNQKEIRELDDLIAIADRGIDQSKAAIVVWRRAHQTMAAGITEPAAIDLFGIAKAAVKKVAPIP